MTLKDYVKNLNEYLAAHPDQAELEVVTSIDDEGNGYNVVYYTPGCGEFLEDRELGEKQVCVN